MVKTYRPKKVYLQRMLEEIQKLELYLCGVDKQRFLTDVEKFDACLIPLIQLGETAHQLIEHYEKIHELPLIHIKGLRNILVHTYNKIQKEELRKIIVDNIPEFKKTLELLLSQKD
ncbi:MAG TPA: DUF86 domain-containing protein [Candidatus Absconditabacterales bacterium]|nr:DUF86 domain-containing protein [Candidatus Absconditabacterales bacterium]HNG97365.1 DUF86 domain-containing protein [Candidatus Absconditabacterales bacterium]